MPFGFYRYRSTKSKAYVRRRKIARRLRDSTTMNIPKGTTSFSDNTDDFRTTIYNSLDTEQKNEYLTQKYFFPNKFRKKNILCDVTLVCENDVEINAHKVVLSSVSQYFFTKFTKYNENRVLLKDFDSSTLESLVDYAYTNEIAINDDNIEAILLAADYLCMEILKNVCANFLLSTITVPSCLRIRAIADLYSCESVLYTCDDFIKQHFTEVIKDENFSYFSSDGLLKMIQYDDLNVSSEITVYTAVIKWLKHDLENRQKHLCGLMRHVRLPFLGTDRLARLLRLEPLFENTPDIQQLFLKALIEENSLSSTSFGIMSEHAPIPRVSYSLNPKIFVFGGSSGDIVEYFDIRSKVWRFVMQLSKGYGTSAVSIRNKIYVSGDCGSEYEKKMNIFDMERRSWLAEYMPVFRRYHSSVLLCDEIYLIGGVDSNNVPLKSVSYYRLGNNSWYNASDMKEPRVYVTAAVLNGKIYAVGGCISHTFLKPCETVEYYDVATSTWNYCKSMNHGRYVAAACVVDNLLYVVGGEDDGHLGDRFEVYDPATDEWELMPNLPTPRMNHGVCYDNGYLFVVGGKWNNSPISSVDVFCYDTKKWFTMKERLSRASSSVVVMAYGS